MADNLASMLCYIPFVGFIISIVFLVMEPYNRNRAVRFHAFQSLGVSVILFVARYIILGVFSGIFVTSFSLGLWGIWAMFLTLFSLACLALYIYLMIMAYQGKTIVLPVIGPFAQKQA